MRLVRSFLLERSSEAVGPNLVPIVPERERARHEAENGFRHFDALDGLIRAGIHQGFFRLQPNMLMTLNFKAVEGFQADAGRYRLSGMKIKNSKHIPVPAEEVPRYIDEMCEYVNANWEKPAVHLAAYVMWRVNWIHAFSDGNGRVARATAYLVLCLRMKAIFPGDRTIPKQIEENKDPYYKALELADQSDLAGSLDLSTMEVLLTHLLVQQIADAATTTWKHPIGGAPPQLAISHRSPTPPPSLPPEPKKTWLNEHWAGVVAAGVTTVGVILAALDRKSVV